MPQGKRYIDASGGAAVSCLGHGHPDVTRGDARAARQARLCAYQLLHHRSRRGTRRPPDRRRAGRASSHVYLVSGGSEAIEAALKMARQYFIETRPAAAPPRHRAPPELSRQHAGRAGGGRQRMAARAIRAAADRDASHRSLLRLSLPASRRNARRPMPSAPREALEAKIHRARPRHRHRFRRRDGGRRHRRRRAAGARATSSASARFATATACC